VIQKLKELSQLKHPLKKLEAIYEAKLAIATSINDYYARSPLTANSKTECLDAE